MKKKISVLLSIIMMFGMYTVPVSALEATPTASTVLVNGNPVKFDAYLIEGNNYFKLRDLAYVLTGTGAQFDVGWNGLANAISLTSGKPYTVVGGEMASGSSGTKTPTLSNSHVVKDGVEKQFTMYTINDNNYFKLRDIGAAFNFGVDWDAVSNSVVIDTGKGYTSETQISNNQTPADYGVIDFGAMFAISPKNSKIDESGADYTYELWQTYNKVEEYVSAMKSKGFNVLVYEKDSIASLEKDNCYVDIVYFWDSDELTLVVTFPIKNNTSTNNQSTNLSMPDEFTFGYIPANFEAMNSYASENGLGDTKVYLDCKITDIEKLKTDSGDVYMCVLTDNDSNKWLCLLLSQYDEYFDKVGELENKSVVICGKYTGFTTVKQKPSITADKIFVKENGKIINTIWQ